MQKAIGIGGVFLKANNPVELAAWYQKHLGIAFGNQLFFHFNEKQNEQMQSSGTAFSFFNNETSYFQPSEKPFMINFKVENLTELFQEFKNEGVMIIGKLEESEYGKFGWVMDPEGNKIELWEPA